MKVINMICYNEAQEMVKGGAQDIGSLGGFFGLHEPMRWNHYIDRWSDDYKPYHEALRQHILTEKLKEGGDWHQENKHGIPVFDDGSVAMFSYRAWGDLMAAVWSEEENTDYNYMDFYMSGYGSVLRSTETYDG